MTRSLREDLEAQDALARHVVETIAVGYRHGRDRSDIFNALMKSEDVRERSYLAEDWELAFGMAETLLHAQNQSAAEGGPPPAHGPRDGLAMPLGLAWAAGVFIAYWIGVWAYSLMTGLLGVLLPAWFDVALERIYAGQLAIIALGVFIYGRARREGGTAGLVGAGLGLLIFGLSYFVYQQLRFG